MVPPFSNQPRWSAIRWRFLQPLHVQITTPCVYARRLIIPPFRVPHTLHVYARKSSLRGVAAGADDDVEDGGDDASSAGVDVEGDAVADAEGDTGADAEEAAGADIEEAAGEDVDGDGAREGALNDDVVLNPDALHDDVAAAAGRVAAGRLLHPRGRSSLCAERASRGGGSAASRAAAMRRIDMEFGRCWGAFEVSALTSCALHTSSSMRAWVDEDDPWTRKRSWPLVDAWTLQQHAYTSPSAMAIHLLPTLRFRTLRFRTLRFRSIPLSRVFA